MEAWGSRHLRITPRPFRAQSGPPCCGLNRDASSWDQPRRPRAPINDDCFVDLLRLFHCGPRRYIPVLQMQPLVALPGDEQAEWGSVMNDRGHGWVIFASIVLGVAGIMRIFDAIWAFRYHGAVPQQLEDALFGTSLKTYGWVWLIVGIILILCSLAVMGRSQLGRWVGIAAGAIGAISAIWWMPYYPIWSLTYIALGVIVIYALAAYGAPAETTLSPQELSRM